MFQQVKILFRCEMTNVKRQTSILTICLCFILLISSEISGQSYSNSDIEICNTRFQLAVDSSLHLLPINEIIINVAETFIGTEYEAFSLEKDSVEQLVINFSGLDCTTFIENVLALSRCIKQQKYSFEDFQNELQLIRYRDGVIDEYPSRLHYMSDWIYDNEIKNIVENVTSRIGGERAKFRFNFMSSHPESYKHLKNNPEFVSELKRQEAEINHRTHYYIPQSRAGYIEDKIFNGDLLFFTTSIEGLDVSHAGIAIKTEGGRTHILHAPNKNYKVQITEKTLVDYLKSNRAMTGIIVVRAVE